MRLDGVSEGKPAQKAGLQKGDIIMALGDTPVENVEGYMKALSQLQKGQNVVIHYTRPGIQGVQQITANL
jgi:S1-C subfamily serine protease